MLQSHRPENAGIPIWVGDGPYPRAEAKVSVFNGLVPGGDAVWEGLRVYEGRVFTLERPLARMVAYRLENPGIHAGQWRCAPNKKSHHLISKGAILLR